MRYCAFVAVCLLAVTAGVSACSAAETTDWDASRDFKFLELQRQLRENPESPEARPCLFAVGEYYFHQKSWAMAAGYFRRFLSKRSRDVEDLLATVFLLRCARELKDAKNALLFEKELQEALSARHFLAIFHAARFQSWTSPLGSRFDFREEVDKMEITLDEKVFYTIRLS